MATHPTQTTFIGMNPRSFAGVESKKFQFLLKEASSVSSLCSAAVCFLTSPERPAELQSVEDKDSQVTILVLLRVQPIRTR